MRKTVRLVAVVMLGACAPDHSRDPLEGTWCWGGTVLDISGDDVSFDGGGPRVKHGTWQHVAGDLSEGAIEIHWTSDGRPLDYREVVDFRFAAGLVMTSRSVGQEMRYLACEGGAP